MRVATLNEPTGESVRDRPEDRQRRVLQETPRIDVRKHQNLLLALERQRGLMLRRNVQWKPEKPGIMLAGQANFTLLSSQHYRTNVELHISSGISLRKLRRRTPAAGGIAILL